MTETSGQRWLPLLKSYNLSGSLAKMCEGLLTSQWGSSAVYLTWRASASKPSHLLFQLVPSMPRTDATASGLLHIHLWPTPDTRGFANEGSMEMLAKKAQTKAEFDGMAYRRGHKERFWPTPVARDYKGQGMSRERQETREPDNLCSWTAKYEGSGALNPTWVEWLMGFPTGWTNLTAEELQAVSKTEPRGSKRLATQSSRKSSRKLAGPSSQRRAGDD